MLYAICAYAPAAGTIAEACEQTGLNIAQLHGDSARAALWDLPQSLQVIYVMHVSASGRLQTPAPAELAQAAGRTLSRSVGGPSLLSSDVNGIQAAAILNVLVCFRLSSSLQTVSPESLHHLPHTSCWRPMHCACPSQRCPAGVWSGCCWMA